MNNTRMESIFLKAKNPDTKQSKGNTYLPWAREKLEHKGYKIGKSLVRKAFSVCQISNGLAVHIFSKIKR